MSQGGPVDDGQWRSASQLSRIGDDFKASPQLRDLPVTTLQEGIGLPVGAIIMVDQGGEFAQLTLPGLQFLSQSAARRAGRLGNGCSSSTYYLRWIRDIFALRVGVGEQHFGNRDGVVRRGAARGRTQAREMARFRRTCSIEPSHRDCRIRERSGRGEPVGRTDPGGDHPGRILCLSVTKITSINGGPKARRIGVDARI
jgi:hypothetical protein